MSEKIKVSTELSVEGTEAYEIARLICRIAAIEAVKPYVVSRALARVITLPTLTVAAARQLAQETPFGMDDLYHAGLVGTS